MGKGDTVTHRTEDRGTGVIHFEWGNYIYWVLWSDGSYSTLRRDDLEVIE